MTENNHHTIAVTTTNVWTVDSKDRLFDLGRIALQTQSVYLKLKIEKELAGEAFDKEDKLLEASIEWKRASNEYRSFFTSMQGSEESA